MLSRHRGEFGKSLHPYSTLALEVKGVVSATFPLLSTLSFPRESAGVTQFLL
jgi:hypothetical protein